MSSSKGRFPGRPSTKNGRHKIRKSSQSSTKSKEKTPTAISTVEENLHEGFLEDFSSDDESAFHGFTEEKITFFCQKADEKSTMFEELIQEENPFHGFTDEEINNATIKAKDTKHKLKKIVKKVQQEKDDSSPKKVLLRPSKLGQIGSISEPTPPVEQPGIGSVVAGSSSVVENETSDETISKSPVSIPTSKKSAKKPPVEQPMIGNVVATAASSSSIVVENEKVSEETTTPFSNRTSGKRIVKPSFKLKESPMFKQDIASASSPKMSPGPNKITTEYPNSTSDQDSSTLDFVDCAIPEAEKPLIRASKLILNEKLLEKLRKPSQQVEFYQQIQRSMQSADRKPPKLVQGPESIHPAGTALVTTTDDESVNTTDTKKTNSTGSTNNRMPGNIVCGICGAVRYYAFILQAKKFGTFSCEPCRKFISKTIKKCNNSSEDDELFPCLTGSGLCVVPPVLRATSGQPKKAETSVPRCQACWLKLCLIGYKLGPELYEKLRNVLPIVFHDLLPANHEEVHTLVPNRGEILDFNRQVPLSRPLFDGFGSINVDSTTKPTIENKKAIGSGSASDSSTQSNVVMERLPNGWSKKAVKRLSGTSKGKWDMYLITPDQQQLRSATELKVYTAKSGAVIDSNLVNFALPKKTAKVDRKFNDLKKTNTTTPTKKKTESPAKILMETEEEEVDDSESKENEQVDVVNTSPILKAAPQILSSPHTCPSPIKAATPPAKIVVITPKLSPSPKKLTKMAATSSPKKNRNVIVLPKSSRREVKVPLKYREEETKTVTPNKIKTSTTPQSKKVARSPPSSVLINEKTPEIVTNTLDVVTVEKSPEKEDILTSKPLNHEELKAAIAQESTMVAIKSEPERRKSYQELSKLGVGTFRIDEETAHGMASGRFTKKIKIKRCGACIGCRTKNCRQCHPCLQMKKYGGPGLLKQACIHRKCTNPLNSNGGGNSSGRILKKGVVKKFEPVKDETDVDLEGNTKTSVISIMSSNMTFHEVEVPEVVEESTVELEDDNPLNTTPTMESPLPRIPIPPRSNDRPKLSYSGLIAMAIQNLPGQKATLNDIYDWIKDAFPYYNRIDAKGWQNSIRHNLSLSKAFYRTKGQAARKGGGIWRIDPKHSIGAFKKLTLKNSSTKPKTVRFNESFWEPDNDMYNDPTPTKQQPIIIHEEPATKMVKLIASPAIKQPKPLDETEREARRQSIEEFIEMGMTSSPNKPTFYVNADELEHIPTPPVIHVAVKKSQKVNFISGVDKSNKPSGTPYAGSTDFYKAYDPDEVAQSGQSVITTENLPIEALCFLCGSAGEEELLFCKSCCEPYHPFCLNPEELPMTSEAEVNWLCRKCIQCQICGLNNEDLLRCSQCSHAFHRECLQPSQQNMIDHQTAIGSWKCGQCLKCQSCQTANVMHFDPDENIPLCDQCCLQKKKGSYCPLCEMCYDDNDYDAKMMECAQCGGWIHAKCEGLDAEKYQILSFLPNTVDYVCKKCLNNSGQIDDLAPWRQALNKELKDSLLNICKKLMQTDSFKNFPESSVILVEHVKPTIEHAKRKLDFNVDDDDNAEKQQQQIENNETTSSKNITKIEIIKNTCKPCQIQIKDLKTHPWWGQKIRELLPHQGKSVIRPKILKQKVHEQQVQQQLQQQVPQQHEQHLEQQKPQPDLQQLENQIENGAFTSILMFHLKLKKILKACPLPKSIKNQWINQFLEEYKNITSEVLPWFDPDKPLQHFEAFDPYLVRQPRDHKYSKNTIVQNNSEPEIEPRWKSRPRITCKVDRRVCSFCGLHGDRRSREAKEAGRLLHYRQNEWVHANCALWSSEVYEEVDGSLQNVSQALSRGSKLTCTVCNKRGATIGCCYDYCKENYHFECGLSVGAAFKEDKSVFCPKHQNYWDVKDNANNTDFSLDRLVHIDVEAELKKKPKWVDLRTVQCYIGSLKVQLLGKINLDLSDNSQALIPLGFTCSRWFWSTLDPNKRVQYVCRTRLKKAKKTNFDDSDAHLVIDHETTEDKKAEKELNDMRIKLRQIEISKAKKSLSNILPPYAISSLWKNLKYQDLHEEDPKDALDAEVDVTPRKRLRLTPNKTRLVDPQVSGGKTSANSSPRSLNKAITNVLSRTPSKILENEDLIEAFKKDFRGSDLLNTVLNEPVDEDVEIIQTWYNQNKKLKVTEVSIQCNLPYSRTNREIDELYELHQQIQIQQQQQNIIIEESEIISDCESEASFYEDFVEDFEGEMPESNSVLATGSEMINNDVQEAVDLVVPLEPGSEIITNNILPEVEPEVPISVSNDFVVEDSNSNSQQSEASSTMDMLSYVVDKLGDNPKDLVTEDNDLELLQQILELPDEDQPEPERPDSRFSPFERSFQELKAMGDGPQLEQDAGDDEDGEEMVNNNDFLCISNETSPEKLVLPDPIQNIPQFDGINDENFVKSISEINGNKCKLISDVPIKPCRLQVADLKNHPWYGKIVRRQLPDILPDFENIPQFDGTDDDNANNDEKICPKKPCFKCSRCVFKSDSRNKLIEHFQVKHLLSRKTKITRQTLLPEKLVKIPQFDGADDDNDNEKKSDQDSPRKDFTIAGLLSPPPQQQPKREAPDDDDVIFVTTASRAPSVIPNVQVSQQRMFVTPGPSSRSASVMGQIQTHPSPMAAAAAFPTYRPPLQQQQPQIHHHHTPTLHHHQPAPSIYVQHLPNPGLTANFAQSFQQQTGRPLQYVTSFPTAAMSATYGSTLPLGFQLAPAPSLQPVSYVTPQGIIISNQPQQPHQPQFGLPTAAFQTQPAILTTGSPAQYLPMATTTPLMMSSNASPFYNTSTHTHCPTPRSPSVIPSTDQPKQERKVAYVQPQIQSSHAKPSSSSKQKKVDPIKALSSMASQPMINTTQSSSLSISHARPSATPLTGSVPPTTSSIAFEPSPSTSRNDKQRSVGTQAKIGAPVKIMTPRPWKEVGTTPSLVASSTTTTVPPSLPSIGPPPVLQENVPGGAMSSGVCSAASSRPTSNRSVQDRPASNRFSPFERSFQELQALNQQTEKEIIPTTSSPKILQKERPASTKSDQEPQPRSVIEEDHSYYCSSPEIRDEFLVYDQKVVDGIKIRTKQSRKNSVKLVLQKNLHNDNFRIQEMEVQDGSWNNDDLLTPKAATEVIKAKTGSGSTADRKSSKRKPKLRAADLVVPLDHKGRVIHSQEQFVNEVQPSDQMPIIDKIKEEPTEDEDLEDDDDENEDQIIYELTSEDGYKAASKDINKLWAQVLNAVSEARLLHGMVPLAVDPVGSIGYQMLGLTHSAISYLIEQLPGAKNAEQYILKHHEKSEKAEIEIETTSGCARGEPFKDRKPLDMFSWLASKHRKRPNFYENNDENDVQLAAARRITSLDLPMAMRFRHLAKNAKEAVGVYSSGIHGRGLFCKREIQAGEMVIEYAGEEIRPMLTDNREKYYESRGIGCYMFKIDDDTVIDATMKGNAARFINHSCEPNCYSKIVEIFGKKHIIIFAQRLIIPGEELTYDYKFPIEDVKIPCSCSARKCRKYMN